MKKIIVILICFHYCSASGQDIPNYGMNRVRITLQDKTILADLDQANSKPTIKTNLTYYWYDANVIHLSQGGFSGKLLNGQYNEYYLSKNLKQQGFFKKGLKDGIWKTWNEDGSVSSIIKWNKGVEIIQKKVPIWKRINFLKKKDKSVDSLNSRKK